MTLGEVIAYADDIKPNAFTDETKTKWINEVEGLVQTEVLLVESGEIITYDWVGDQGTELLVAPPHDKLYGSYLCAMIDFANGEYDRYNNTMALFNSHFGEFVRWFGAYYHPADCVKRVKGEG